MGSLYAVSYFIRSGIPNTIFDQLQSGFSASAEQVAALSAIFFLLYAAAQIPVGMLACRWGGMRTLLAGGAIMAAGTAWFSQAGSLGWLYAARAMMGLGGSVMFLSITRDLDRLFGHRNFALSMGVLLAMGYSGGMAAMAPFDQAARAWGWRSVLLGVAGFSAAALVACVAIGGRRSISVAPAAGFSLRDLRAVVTNRLIYPPIIGGFLNSSIYFLLQNTLGKKFLMDAGGLGPSEASTFTLIMVATAAGVVFFSGVLSRWIGNRRKPLAVAAVALTLVATSVILACIELRLAGWVFLCAYMMYAVSTGLAAMFVAAVREVNPPSVTAVSVGYYNGGGYLIVALVTQAAGAILNRYPAAVTATATVYPHEAYRTLFLTLLGVAAVAMACTLAMRETHGRTRVPEAEMA
jgi:MFS family permease